MMGSMIRRTWVINLSSAQDWIAIGFDKGIWLIKRDGTNFHKLTDGKYPDFSPDARKLVFVRNDGLYTTNRDGSNLKRIISDPNATHPAWSSEGGRIAYNTNYNKGLIIDTIGNLITSFNDRFIQDWGPSDSNAILTSLLKLEHKTSIIYLSTGIEDTLLIFASKWSPNGKYFIGNKTIYTRQGVKLFTIKP